MHFLVFVAIIIFSGLSFKPSAGQSWQGYEKPSRENIAIDRMEYNVHRLENWVNRLDSWMKKQDSRIDNNSKVKECRLYNGLTQVSGYVQSVYGYHKLHLNRLSWTEARKSCICDGGHLAIINSEAENRYLARMVLLANDEIKKITPDDWNGVAWVGVSKVDNKWLTVTNAPANDYWGIWNGQRHPKNDLNHKVCAAQLYNYYNSYDYKFGMLSFDCNKKFVYICEINPK